MVVRAPRQQNSELVFRGRKLILNYTGGSLCPSTSSKRSPVSLPREIPVRMLYQTVLLDDEGQPIVRSDPYGWNDRVATALGFGAGTSYRVKTDDADVGP